MSNSLAGWELSNSLAGAWEATNQYYINFITCRDGPTGKDQTS